MVDVQATALDQLHLMRQHHDESPTAPGAQMFAQAPQLVVAQDVDWDAVDTLRDRVISELPALGNQDPDSSFTERDLQELGRKLIYEAIADEHLERPMRGQEAWTEAERRGLAEATFDMIFRLGRLQPLVDNTTVENVVIMGHDRVTLQHTDGSHSTAPAVARSDADLIRQVQFLAERTDGASGQARSFSPSNPTLRMTLPSGERMTAKAWVTPVPTVVIRRHRLVEVTLEDLTEREMMTPLVASFLRAAVRAKKSIVVAGPQSAGKTTLMRAICAEIPPSETIATFETQFELFLHQMRQAHPIVHAYEAAQGGEIGVDGRRIGAFSLTDALEASMADFIQRMIVGEVVGKEIWALVKAAESGAGAMCTTHGRTAVASLEKLVTCMMEYGPSISAELATRKLTECVDIVVQLGVETLTDQGQGPRLRRWVSEIIFVESNPDAPGGIGYTNVFGGPFAPQATAATLPHQLRDLAQHGFDIDAFLAEGSAQTS